MENKILIALALLISSGCSLTDDSQDLSITGDWVWIESTGGIAGTTETPTSTGDTILVTITSNTIRKYTNGSLTFESSYTIQTMESVIYGGQHAMIVYGNGFKQTFRREGKKLYLSDECNDCFVSIYSKG
ncbi:hypothetical protein ACFO5O_05905 [Geojedonia litorea]|uniref:Lipocalin-like domain-containing protein n=1 Tax=Geojedonia litorea TaxID=1268269 RepID=A0ABV9N4V2_9FLAO